MSRLFEQYNLKLKEYARKIYSGNVMEILNWKKKSLSTSALARGNAKALGSRS